MTIGIYTGGVFVAIIIILIIVMIVEKIRKKRKRITEVVELKEFDIDSHFKGIAERNAAKAAGKTPTPENKKKAQSTPKTSKPQIILQQHGDEDSIIKSSSGAGKYRSDEVDVS